MIIIDVFIKKNLNTKEHGVKRYCNFMFDKIENLNNKEADLTAS